MGEEKAICQNVFSVPGIVIEHTRRNPQLRAEFHTFCREEEYSGNCVFYGETEKGPFRDEFCRFQGKVKALEERLESLRRERVRWAERAESFWQKKAGRLGNIHSVVGGRQGRVDISIHIPWDSVRVMLFPAVAAGKRDEQGSVPLIDGGFRVWFDSPSEARRWLTTNFSRLPQVFSACKPRLDFVPLKDNVMVDHLYPCWEKRAKAQGIEYPGTAWQVMFHPRAALVF